MTCNNNINSKGQWPLCMAVVGGRVCVLVPNGTKGSFRHGGESWMTERKYDKLRFKGVLI